MPRPAGRQGTGAGWGQRASEEEEEHSEEEEEHSEEEDASGCASVAGHLDDRRSVADEGQSVCGAEGGVREDTASSARLPSQLSASRRYTRRAGTGSVLWASPRLSVCVAAVPLGAGRTASSTGSLSVRMRGL